MCLSVTGFPLHSVALCVVGIGPFVAPWINETGMGGGSFCTDWLERQRVMACRVMFQILTVSRVWLHPTNCSLV